VQAIVSASVMHSPAQLSSPATLPELANSKAEGVSEAVDLVEKSLGGADWDLLSAGAQRLRRMVGVPTASSLCLSIAV
jgi:hypothetical protein